MVLHRRGSGNRQNHGTRGSFTRGATLFEDGGLVDLALETAGHDDRHDPVSVGALAGGLQADVEAVGIVLPHVAGRRVHDHADGHDGDEVQPEDRADAPADANLLGLVEGAAHGDLVIRAAVQGNGELGHALDDGLAALDAFQADFQVPAGLLNVHADLGRASSDEGRTAARQDGGGEGGGK